MICRKYAKDASYNKLSWIRKSLQNLRADFKIPIMLNKLIIVFPVNSTSNLKPPGVNYMIKRFWRPNLFSSTIIFVLTSNYWMKQGHQTLHNVVTFKTGWPNFRSIQKPFALTYDYCMWQGHQILYEILFLKPDYPNFNFMFINNYFAILITSCDIDIKL